MNISNWFFRLGVIAVLIGMGLGIWMGKEENFTLAPAHAHLNLIGFVLPFIYGFFYRSFPSVAAGWSARLHLLLWLVGVGAMVVGLVLFLPAQDKTYLPILITGETTTALAMLVFAINVWRGVGRSPAPIPAE
jgi:hypothetical protein